MRIDFADPALPLTVRRAALPAARRWGVDSEYGRLTDVLLCAPDALEPVACCDVTKASLRDGFAACREAARAQHDGLAAALRRHGVRVHVAEAVEGLPDLAFARDCGLMTPWGFVELAPAAGHRRAEAAHVAARVKETGAPSLGRIERGTVEGGDVCVLRPGLVVIGCSGARTSEEGAAELAALFGRHGWRALIQRFDPHFLHLDTMFTMLDQDHALAAVDVLDDAFLEEMERIGLRLVPVTYKEVQRLAGNVVSLGDGKIVAAAHNERVNRMLRALGFQVIALPLDQFTRCGGGPHCLTLPLAREVA